VTDSGRGQSAQPWPSRGAAWYAITVLFVAYVFSFADRYVLSLLIEPIKQDLGLSDTKVSLLHGFAFAIFYTLLGIPIGRLADRHSRRLIISAGVATWSAMTALCGLAQSFSQLFAARIGVGVGEATLSPAATSMIADLFPPHLRGQAMGVYSSGAMVGAGLAFIIGGIVVQAISSNPTVAVAMIGEVRSWQAAFLVLGIPGLLVAAWVYSLGEPRRRTHGSDPAADVIPTLGAALRFMRDHWRVYVPHFLGFTMLALVFNATLAWLPTFMLREFSEPVGRSGPAIGLALLIFGSAGIIAGGWYSDLLTRRGSADAPLRVGVIAGLGSLPFAVLATLMPTAAGTVAMSSALFFFSTSAFGAAIAALQEVTPNRMRAFVAAIYFFSGNLFALGLGPTIVALCTDFLFQSDAAVGLSIALVAGLASVLAAVVLYAGLTSFRARVVSIRAGAAPA
jgi:MFS family permease